MILKSEGGVFSPTVSLHLSSCQSHGVQTISLQSEHHHSILLSAPGPSKHPFFVATTASGVNFTYCVRCMCLLRRRNEMCHFLFILAFPLSYHADTQPGQLCALALRDATVCEILTTSEDDLRRPAIKPSERWSVHRSANDKGGPPMSAKPILVHTLRYRAAASAAHPTLQPGTKAITPYLAKL